MNASPSPSDLEAFRGFVEHEIGLGFGDDRLPLLAEVLAARLRATECATTVDYLDRLAPTSGEIAELARRLTISETYFFRDPNQFHALQAILRQREARGERHLRLLSAGCSSGEEAYSLAILVRETLRDLGQWTVRIRAVDLNPDALEKARSACYPAWSLRGASEDRRHRYLRDTGRGHAVAESVRAMVRFDPENLLRPALGLWEAEAFDVVFCRNVLMYLTPSAAAALIAGIARSLAPGGHLFLGHAENLRGLSRDFDLEHDHGTFYYRRRPLGPASCKALPQQLRLGVPAEPARAAAYVSWFDAIDRASKRVAELSRDAGHDRRQAPEDDGGAARAPPAAPSGDLSPALELMRQERFHEALGLLAGRAAAGADALLLRAMLLVGTGEPVQAERLCEDIVALDPLNAGAHYIKALCREHAEDRPEAVEHHRIAAYLDAEFAMPHLQLGRLARRAGDLVRARRELEIAIGLLPREDAARILLFGGGFGREVLAALCRGELDACGGRG